jgi:hypothetical protein
MKINYFYGVIKDINLRSKYLLVEHNLIGYEIPFKEIPKEWKVGQLRKIYINSGGILRTPKQISELILHEKQLKTFFGA